MAEQLYDLSLVVTKADTETNINISAPGCAPIPPPIPAITGPIGTTTDSDAFHDSYTRKTFYADGRWWVFWGISSSNPYGLEESSSADLVHWTGQVDLDLTQSPAIGYGLGVWYDPLTDTFRYVSAGGAPYSTHARYRVGTPHSDGSISWLAGEQTTPYNAAFGGPYSIITDNTGHDWISDSGSGAVYKNGHNDGTWSQVLSHSVTVNNRSGIVPLGMSGGIAIVYTADAGHHIYVQYYNGSTWSAHYGPTTHNIDSSTGGVAGYAMVTVGNEIHITGVDSSGDVWYVLFDCDTNAFYNEQTLVATGQVYSRPMISKDYQTNIYVFYPNPSTNKMYYLQKTYTDIWSAPLLFTPAEGSFPGDERFASTWDDSGGNILVTFLTNFPLGSWTVWGAYLATH